MTFPLLEMSGICTFFRDHCPELDITEADFRKPQKEKWQSVFVNLMTVIAGTNPDSINQPSLEAQGKMDYPELCEDSVPLLNLTLVVQRVAYVCGVPDITIMNIIQPTPKRLLRICSALINFMHFQTERLDVYERFKTENMALQQHRDTLRQENDELQQQINKIRASRAEKEPEVKQGQEQLQELESQLADMHKSAAILQKNKADIRAKISESGATQARFRERQVSSKEENARLAGQIVQSPERVKGEMERMQRHLEQLRCACKERRARLVELQRKQSQMKQWDMQAEDMERLMKAISEKISKEKEIMAEIRKMQEQQSQLKDRLQELVAEEKQMRRHVAAKHDKLAKINMQHCSKMQDLKETLSSLQREKERLLQEQCVEEDGKRRLMETQQELRDLDLKNAKAHEAAMANMRSKYGELLEALDTYNAHLGEAWQKVSQAFRETS